MPTPQADKFTHDVFLSHSAKDKDIVRDIAQRLKNDGIKVWFDEWELKPSSSISAKIEQGLEHSRILILCMSKNTFGSDWAQLESSTFRFRDPLNRRRRFIPLRLDDVSLQGSFGQFLYINWFPADRAREYERLLEACRPPPKSTEVVCRTTYEKLIHLEAPALINCYSFDQDRMMAITADIDNDVRLWDLKTGRVIRIYKGHTAKVNSVLWSNDRRYALSGSTDRTMRLWNLETGHSTVGRGPPAQRGRVQAIAWNNKHREALFGSADEGSLWVRDLNTGEQRRIFENQFGILSLSVSPDQSRILVACGDKSIQMRSARWWGGCLLVLNGHFGHIRSMAWSADCRRALSGSDDKTVRIWDTKSGRCLHVLEGHTGGVQSVAWLADDRLAITASSDTTVRIWDSATGSCLEVFEGHGCEVRTVEWDSKGCRTFTGDMHGKIWVRDLTELVDQRPKLESAELASRIPPDQLQYTNAKVLLVGDTHAGKTALTQRLATDEWRSSEDSTVGAWSTQWRLKDASSERGVDREIWLWDFGGQADQRLIHQLYMDRAALILLLFNADQEDILPGLRDWLTALRRCVKEELPHFIVAGRIDTGFKASRGKLQAFAHEQGLAYYETSAKSGEGCNQLRAAIIAGIPWTQMEKRTSPRIFKLIKDEILNLRDEGQVLHTFKELRELLWQRLPDESRFTDETLQTVISLLDGPGVVKELDYGTYILLAPEWINAYAQAVIRTLRNAENDLGAIPLRSIAEGNLIYQSIGRDGAPTDMKRLPSAEERVILGEMELQLEQRGLCLRQGDKLVFPSHCGRDRPAVLEHPSVFVSYAVKGFLDDIYATLVVKLADSESFQLKELWRDAADFVTLAGDHHMGIKLTRESGSDGDICIYFSMGVTQQEQVIFANYIHRHLEISCEQAQRLRHYVCPKCQTPKGNAEVLMKKLLRDKENADTECDNCGERFSLWDALEKKFASETVREQVEALQAEDLAQLTTRRKGKLLVLDVGARITSANQKWIEVPGDEDDGIDIMVEFTDDEGNGVGKGLCLQLKSGNSFLKKRQTDDAEIFAIKRQRWVKTWMNQPYPVMLVIGSFSEGDDDRRPNTDKLEFADVRWMEITSELKRLSANGTKPVKQLEFKGERLDMTSIRRWRDKILNA